MVKNVKNMCHISRLFYLKMKISKNKYFKLLLTHVFTLKESNGQKVSNKELTSLLYSQLIYIFI